SAPSNSLAPSADLEKCLEIEKRLDDIAGVQVRRLYYSESLMDSPAEVRQIFAKDLTFFNKMVLRGSWGMVRKVMIKSMDIGKEQREDSKEIINQELDWLDDILSDGRQFLVGDKFSRADLTAASLLAVIVTPKEHPVYNDIAIPPKMTADMKNWQDRPSIKWVRNIYSQHR
ncbi:MAG: glutathione binding-like protein, partial [Thermodesulfobacteriota bacterium]